MNSQQLRALESLAKSSIEEVQASSPELFTEVQAKAVDAQKTAVLSSLGSTSTELREHVESIDFTAASQPDVTVKDVVVESLTQPGVPTAVVREGTERLGELEAAGVLVPPAATDRPLAEQPFLAEDFDHLEVLKLVDAAAVPEAKVDEVISRVKNVAEVTNESIGQLVESGILDEEEARQLGLSASLYNLADQYLEIADALKSSEFDRVPGKTLTDVRDLVHLDESDWSGVIDRSGVILPEGLDRDGYAAELAKRVTDLFPTDALMTRTLAAKPGAIRRDIDRVGPLLDRSKGVFGSTFDELDTDGIAPDEVPVLRRAHTSLQHLANLHPGLGIEAILNGDAPPAEKAAAVSDRLALVDRVYRANPEKELLTLDYSPDSADVAAMDFAGLGEEERRMVLTDLKAAQRSFAITNDVAHAQALLEAGYHSATSVARGSFESFRARIGLPDTVAERYYDEARAVLSAVATTTVSIADAYRGIFDDLRVGNSDPSIEDYLRKFEGFADLFGSQDYCSCQHCQSILSPAAYFADLMAFVEEHVLDEVFTGTAQNHPLNLKVRRPDLWTLPLTCKNTDELVPYLDIINEILENYLANRRGFTGDPTDRPAVEDVVYRQAIATTVDSFQQPFLLPLEKVDAYLVHFERPRTLIARTLGAQEGTVAAATLGISKPEFDLITQANTDLDFLRHVYGIQFNLSSGSTIDSLDAQVMVRRTGLTRELLGDLVETEFVTESQTHPIEIRPEKKSVDSVQNDVERIHNLTADSLDRMHRFTRLSRRVPWSVQELDLVLSHLVEANLAVGIDDVTLRALVPIMDLQARWDLPVEQNCALWSETPRTEVETGRGPLFDRLFNLRPFVLLDGPLPKDGVKFVHPSFRSAGTAVPADNTLHRLLAGLQVGDEQLAQLISRLATALGADLSTSNEDDRGFLLTHHNLTLLYRHARLSKLLRLSIPKLFQLLDHAGLGFISGLSDLRLALEFWDWWHTTSFTLDEIGFITRGIVEDPTSHPDASSMSTRIVMDVQSSKALEFADTVFAFIPGVTEDQSRAIVAANPASIEPGADASLRLALGFDPSAPLTVPAGIPTTGPAARDVVLKYHASQILPSRVAAQAGLPAQNVTEIIAMTGSSLSDPALVTALRGGDESPLVDLLAKVLPLTVLLRSSAFDPPALQYVRAHGDVFGITDFNDIGVDAVRKLSTYAGLVDTSATASFTPLPVTVDPESARRILLDFDPVTRFAGADTETLAGVLGTDAAMVSTLLPNITLAPTAPEALSMLSACVELARYLGVDGETLRLILSDDYGDLSRAGEAVLSAIRSKYPDENEFHEKVEAFEDRVRSRKRDALSDFLIRSIQPEFDSMNELYEHFLIDVSLDGCARTSWLVAAISSVQLYVHRCLMNLEQDRRDPTDPDFIRVLPASIPISEWSWRKNYRVWEANRKVFLYPENYIEPELRDDKTPLFRELESTLLEQEINEQTVLDAYSAYLGGFGEVAKLKIAGAYHDRHPESRTDILHLFGVTPGDPPTFYYRAVENALYGETDARRGIVWSPWRKVDVQIPARRVAPIVHLGRLFLFWIEITTSPQNEVKDAGSQFAGYRHKLSLKYTSLRLDGKWTAPQRIPLRSRFTFLGDSVISDPLAEIGEGAPGNLIPRHDTEIHREPQDGYTLTGFEWDRPYPEISSQGLVLDLLGPHALGPVDLYENIMKFGPIWGPDGPKPFTVAHSGQHRVFFSKLEGDSSVGRYGVFGPKTDQIWWSFFDDYSFHTAALDRRRLDELGKGMWSGFADSVESALNVSPTQVLRFDSAADLQVVNGSPEDVILDVRGDLFLHQASVRAAPRSLLRRLGTTLSDSMARTLFTGGLDALLDTKTQSNLREAPLPVTLLSGVENGANAGRLDFRGPYGTYYREIFFHVPFLIANQLNSQQRFAAAQRWYQYIFDPTASEAISVRDRAGSIERARRERDRVWRYLAFRGLDVPKLRDVLTDPAAIEVYKKDPFNPHAIARLRLSAYQKSIVMKYIDNLLDWGDSLFSQFTMESVNEALMLYVLAADLLGPRPAALGSCGEGKVTPKTYETIGPLIKQGSEFLPEIETWLFDRTGAVRWRSKSKLSIGHVIDRATAHSVVRVATGLHDDLADSAMGMISGAPLIAVSGATAASSTGAVPTGPSPMRDDTTLRSSSMGAGASGGSMGAGPSGGSMGAGASGGSMGAGASGGSSLGPSSGDQLMGPPPAVARPMGWNQTRIGSWGTARDTGVKVLHNDSPIVADFERTRERGIRFIDNDSPLIRDFDRLPGFGWCVARQLSPVFCIPRNGDLLQYWDRVEDRLYKIRHCMDISGIRRQLALFAPEIDPRLLVRARAAGLTIEDVLNATSGDLPPYRFSYLIEKAKQHASVVQGFGAALLSALEKKDLEDLNHLRAVQQQNLLKMTTRVREWEIDIAADAVATLERQRDAVQYRKEYYQGLLDGGLTPWELTQQISRHVSSVLTGAAGVIDTVAGVVYLLPQVGSPFAMKYGGLEAGNSANAWATVLRDAAAVAEAVSASAGLEAGLQRRDEGWEHQVKLAEHELRQIEKQLAAANLRKEIAVRSLEIHNKSIEQLEEMFDFFNNRFTSLALFTWLSTTLQRMYREAYNSAYAMARLAEQAFRFERGDDTSPLLQSDYWDPARAGLLAGERLLIDLENMERRFIETNYRSMEIDQSFSLTQVDPAALLQLRETGECEFEIPELFYDLFYPGQYRRRIKSVRLTIPCVTGPYTNVSATLTLTGSKMRSQPQLGAAALSEVPVRRSVSIATSTAQNDSGVFEFSFRDDRYMPFEGQGAISSWKLSMPKNFRQFDYQTVTDVIIHISYTAEEDGLFRNQVEQLNATIEGTILHRLSNDSLARSISLRQDVSGAFNRILHSAPNTTVTFDIADAYVPIFLRGRNLLVTRALMLLRTAAAQEVNNVSLSLDGQSLTGFARDPTVGNLWSTDLGTVFAGGLLGSHTIQVTDAGNLAPIAPPPGDDSALDDKKLLDVILYVEYQVS